MTGDIHADFERWLIESGHKIPHSSSENWVRIVFEKGDEPFPLLYKGNLTLKTMLYFYDPEPRYGGYFSLDTVEAMLKDGWNIKGGER